MSKDIQADLVRHIARLSRIALDESRADELARQFADILGYFDKLQELDTSDVQPLVHPMELSNVFGADDPHASLTPEEALANAPQRDGDFYRVPKVIGDSL